MRASPAPEARRRDPSAPGIRGKRASISSGLEKRAGTCLTTALCVLYLFYVPAVLKEKPDCPAPWKPFRLVAACDRSVEA